jgi:VanZ family protein
VPIGAVIVLVFALIEELSQLFFMHRTFDLIDVAADLIGITLSVIILKKYQLKRH